VFNYGATTIPRHLRDVVITEYGLADLRGRTDSETIAALLNIADSRFQDELLRAATAAGKIARDYRIPDAHRHNTPAALESSLASHRRAGLFSEYPFGTDFTAEEIVLAKALKRLKDRTGSFGGRAVTIAESVVRGGTPARFRPYLERLKLDRPATAGEWLLGRLVTVELHRELG
jgi:hypothetical protein